MRWRCVAMQNIKSRAVVGVLVSVIGSSVGCARVDENTGLLVSELLRCTSAQGYSSGVARTICVATVDGKPVEVHTADAYLRMQSAAAAAGVSLRIVSGFRTMAQQQYLYNQYLCCGGNLAARPGYSNHQSGLALDLNTSTGGVYRWLAANAGRFGFIRTVPSEDWPWGFRGAVTCTPRCEDGDTIIGSDCRRGECGVFGAGCVNDSRGARCVFGACPATGTATVCLNERILATCNNGAASSGDCGAFAGFCSTAGRDRLSARCVSAFCVDSARDVPVAHDGCWIQGGQMLHCDRNGAATTSACPSGQACSMLSGRPRCEPRVCPATGTPKICVADRYIAQCMNGAVTDPGDCGAFGAYCSTAGGVAPRCVSVFCVANAREVPRAKEICLPDGRRASCNAQGVVRNAMRCPTGQTCVATGDTVRCVAGTPDAGTTDAAAGDAVTEMPEDDDDNVAADVVAVDAATPIDEAGERPEPADAAASAPRDGAAEAALRMPVLETQGCACRAGAQRTSPRHGTWALLAGLALIARRRQRGARR